MIKSHKSKLLIVVLLGFMPFYLFTFISKIAGDNGFSVFDVLGIQTIFSLSGLFILWILCRLMVKNNFMFLNRRSATFLQDLTAAFLILISLYCVIMIGRLTWYPLVSPQIPPHPTTLETIQWILQRPFYTVLLLVPVLLLTQTYLEISRALLITALGEKTRPWQQGASIILVSFLFGLMNINAGWTSILMQFQTALVFGTAYHYTRRLIPLIIASYLYQALGLIDFLLQ